MDDNNYVVAEEFLIEGGTLKEYKGKDKVVVVPDGITEIAPFAFWYHYHSGLEEIHLPDSLEEIAHSAFDSCCNLKRIQWPESFKRAGTEDVVQLEGTVLKKYIWYQENVIVPRGITEIGVKAFYGMGTNNCIENIILPDSIKIIRDEAFLDCKRLKSIFIPSGVKK